MVTVASKLSLLNYSKPLYSHAQIRYSSPTLRRSSTAAHRPIRSIRIAILFMKTNKSFTKRIKVTKNGKLVARKPGQNHFNARQTGRQRLRRKRANILNFSPQTMRRFLPGNGGKGHADVTAAEVEANQTKD